MFDYGSDHRCCKGAALEPILNLDTSLRVCLKKLQFFLSVGPLHFPPSVFETHLKISLEYRPKKSGIKIVISIPHIFDPVVMKRRI